MDILDKLFSRELNRRAGERAIKIDAEEKNIARKRSKTLGKNALGVINKKPNEKHRIIKTIDNSKSERGSFFHRINIRFPWLKIAAVCLIGFIAILDLLDLTISKTGDPYDKIRLAPMQRHIRSTNRDFYGKKLVALTFDDGPSGITTPRLLDVLAEKDVLATFFVLGSMARNNPDIVRRASREGHEIANHTTYHQNLIHISAAAVADDIAESKNIYQEILGRQPIYTRPPYGNVNDNVKNIVGTPIILWSVDTLDWQNRDPAAILENTKNQVSDGAIILMHDIYDTSVDAVASLVDELRKDGYEFATISEIAKYRNIDLVDGAIYRRISQQ